MKEISSNFGRNKCFLQMVFFNQELYRERFHAKFTAENRLLLTIVGF